MSEKTPFRCPKFSCRKKFTSDSWPLKQITLHHPEHLQVVHQKNLTSCSMPLHNEPAQRCEFNTNTSSVQDWDLFPYIEHVENIAHSKSQPSPPSLPQKEIYPGACAPLINFITEPWERDTEGCFETILQNNPYYMFAMREEYKYIQGGISNKDMKTYYDNELNKENTSLRFPSFRNGDGIQRLMASTPHDLALGEWELHTLHNMSWNDNHQRPIKYWS